MIGLRLEMGSVRVGVRLWVRVRFMVRVMVKDRGWVPPKLGPN